MTPWYCIITKIPNKLTRKRPVIILLNLSLKLLHQPNLNKKFGKVSIYFTKYSLLHTISKPIVAVLFPQVINDFQVCFGDEFDFSEEA